MFLPAFYHFMPIPVPGMEEHPEPGWRALLIFLLWMVPFAAAYFWHLYHDHKHNHKLEKKLDEIVDLLKRLIDK